jgi:Tol biopolymer transport system component
MPSRSFLRRPAVLLVLSLCAVAAVVSILGRLAGGPDSVKKAVTLVSPGGAEAYPSFSPDGKRLVYSVRLAKDQGFHLFVRNLPYGGRWQLTGAAGSDIAPVWSPDGASVAFLRMENGRAACMVVPAAGGAERKVADCAVAAEMEQPPPAVAWTPDSQSLVVAVAGENQLPAIALVPAAGGAPRILTNPAQGTQGDSTPTVSPDGKTVAFVRTSSAEDADIFACDLSGGNLQRLTFDGRPVRGIAWTPDGSHLVYAGYRMGSWRLWRLPATGGSPRDLGFARNGAQYPAVARAGGHLAYTDSPTVSAIWRAPLGAAADAGAQSLIRSTGRETAPAWSRDGKKIADISDQSGEDEIWVSDAEGGHRTQLSHFNGRTDPGNPRWSPDGRSVLFDMRGSDVAEIDTVPAAGGAPKRVLMNASSASWSNDGKTIYYQSRGQICKASAAGADPQTLTSQGSAGQPAESADGKFVYFAKWRSIWRVPTDGGTEEEAIQSDRGVIMGGAKITAKGAYYVEWNRDMRMRGPGGGRGGMMRAFNSAAPTVCFYDFATRKSSTVFEMQGMDFSGFSVSPDGKYILYPRVDQSETNLMLVEGFK